MSLFTRIVGDVEVTEDVNILGTSTMVGPATVEGVDVASTLNGLDARLDVVEALPRIVAAGTATLGSNGIVTINNGNLLSTDLVFTQLHSLSGVSLASTLRPTSISNGTFDVSAFLVATGLAATLDRSTFFWYAVRP